MSPKNRDTKVAIAGAGVAGLTAALRLSQRGYKVTLYERKPLIGGDLSADKVTDDDKGPDRDKGPNGDKSRYYDVYPHMFGNWYNNFWKIVKEDLGLRQGHDFKPQTGFQYLRQGGFPDFVHVTNFASPYTVIPNLFSGLAPIPDMFLWLYAMNDLASQRFDQSELLNQVSVNGFLRSRPYATNRVAELSEGLIQAIWAVPSYLTSALSFQDFVQYSLPDPDPQQWVLNGNNYNSLMKPWHDVLTRHGCEIETNVSLKKIILDQNRVAAIEVQEVEEELEGFDEKGPTRRVDVDHLILAVPARIAASLVMPTDDDQSIVDLLPELANLRRLHAIPIPMLYIYFKKKLPHIPEEYVALLKSNYDLTFVEIPPTNIENPPEHDGTVLSVAASDFYALPSTDWKKNAHDIIKELHRYIPCFNPGQQWGDDRSDIDWKLSYYQPNTINQLFLNNVGTWKFRPEAFYERIPNLFFAGSYCKTPVNIATVESAVMSGLNAAQALWNQEPLGDPIPPSIEPEQYPESLMMWMKLAWAPYAYGAKCWSKLYDAAPQPAAGRGPKDLASRWMDMTWNSSAFAADWWETTWSMYRDMWSGGLPSRRTKR